MNEMFLHHYAEKQTSNSKCPLNNLPLTKRSDGLRDAPRIECQMHWCKVAAHPIGTNVKTAQEMSLPISGLNLHLSIQTVAWLALKAQRASNIQQFATT